MTGKHADGAVVAVHQAQLAEVAPDEPDGRAHALGGLFDELDLAIAQRRQAGLAGAGRVRVRGRQAGSGAAGVGTWAQARDVATSVTSETTASVRAPAESHRMARVILPWSGGDCQVACAALYLRDEMTEVQIQAPRAFAFERTVRSHGWFDLRPFAYNRATGTLTFAFERAGAAVSVAVRAAAPGRLAAVTSARGAAATRQVQAVVRSVLRLDEDLAPLRAALAGAPELVAAVDAGGGRLLRAPTVFEDVVKMLCTTNCSWGLTHVMVERLVARAGAAGPGGVRAFPTAAALAARPPSFFRDVVGPDTARRS